MESKTGLLNFFLPVEIAKLQRCASQLEVTVKGLRPLRVDSIT